MKLESEFIKLPFKFDVGQLQKELSQFSEADWIPHPNRIDGNHSIPLISTGGTVNDDMSGEMKLTQSLCRSPYIQQVMNEFGEVFGRSRLMRLDGSYEVPEHCDMHYHWFDRVRIHIPIVTNPGVIFHCGNAEVHMAEGEAWLFDSWQMHRVTNSSNLTRVHLVLDTCGSSKFWDMVSRSEYIPSGEPASIPTKAVEFKEGKTVNLLTEKYNMIPIMVPGEVNYLVQDLIDDARRCQSNDPKLLTEFVSRVDSFRKDWRKIWSLYGNEKEGIPYFQRLVQTASVQEDRVRLNSTDISAQLVFYARVLAAAITNDFEIAQGVARFPQATQVQAAPSLAQTRTIDEGSAVFRKSEPPVSRNSPCTCGSGKKYKHCCG